MRKTLVIVEGESHVRAMIPHITSTMKGGNDVTVLALDFESQNVLRKAMLPFRDFGVYLRHNTVDSIDTVAWALANNWGEIKNIRERLSFDGIFLGELFAYDLTLFLTDAFTKIWAVARAIETEHPSLVIAADAQVLGSGIARELANSLGYQLRLVRVPRSRLQVPDLTRMPLPVRLGAINVSLNVSGRFFDAVNQVGNAVAKMVLTGRRSGRKSRDEGRNTRAKVLMLEFNILGGYSDLIKDLGNRGHQVLLVNTRRPLVWSSESIRKLRELDVRSCTLREYLTPKLKRVRKVEVHRVCAIWDDFLSSDEANDAFRFEGVRVLDLVRPALGRLFRDGVSKGLLYLLAMEQLLVREGVSAVVMRNDSLLFERSSVLAARRTGVPSLVIQHGITSRHPIWGPVYADWYAVWGKAGRDALTSFADDASTLVLTGNPRTLRNIDEVESKKTVFATLGIRPEKKLVVYASQPLYGITRFHSLSSLETLVEREELLRSLIDVAETLPNIQLLIKLHPMEGASQTRAWVPEMKSFPVLSDFDVRDLLAACDVLVTVSSTVGLEAMLFEKPVVTVNLTARDNLNPYAGSGAVIEVTSKEDLTDAVTCALEDRGTRASLKRGRENFLRSQLGDRKQALSKVSELIRGICLPATPEDEPAS